MISAARSPNWILEPLASLKERASGSSLTKVHARPFHERPSGLEPDDPQALARALLSRLLSAIVSAGPPTMRRARSESKAPRHVDQREQDERSGHCDRATRRDGT